MARQAGRTAGSRGGPTTPLPPAPARQPRRAQVLTTRVGLQMPAGMAYDEWERAGRQLADVIDSSSWWLGDWLRYGKDHYTDRYQRGIRAVGLSYQTLRNYAWVSRRFDLTRRRPALSFQHHAELASMPVADQELWLDRAEQRQWTTKQLRSALRAARESEQQPCASTEPNRHLQVPGSRLQWWHKAAEQLGVDFEQWVTTTLDSAAASALEELGRPAEHGEIPDLQGIESLAAPAAGAPGENVRPGGVAERARPVAISA